MDLIYITKHQTSAVFTCLLIDGYLDSCQFCTVTNKTAECLHSSLPVDMFLFLSNGIAKSSGGGILKKLQ